VIATKVRFPMGDGPNDIGLSRRRIHQAVDDGLRRLQPVTRVAARRRLADREVPAAGWDLSDEDVRELDEVSTPARLDYPYGFIDDASRVLLNRLGR
jgi:hypothetical protein